MIRDCKVNHMVNPLGFELTRPVFTWKGEQDQYRLVIAADEDLTDIVYDSGMTGLNPLCTRPELKPEPCTRYYWSVGGETQWFETARGEEPWKGRWITCDRKEARHPVFSKTIVPKRRWRLPGCISAAWDFTRRFWTGKNRLRAFCAVLQRLQHMGSVPDL